MSGGRCRSFVCGPGRTVRYPLDLTCHPTPNLCSQPSTLKSLSQTGGSGRKPWLPSEHPLHCPVRGAITDPLRLRTCSGPEATQELPPSYAWAPGSSSPATSLLKVPEAGASGAGYTTDPNWSSELRSECISQQLLWGVHPQHLGWSFCFE